MNRIKNDGNTREKIEEKIDEHLSKLPNILTELRYFQKEKKNIETDVFYELINNLFLLILY